MQRSTLRVHALMWGKDHSEVERTMRHWNLLLALFAIGACDEATGDRAARSQQPARAAVPDPALRTPASADAGALSVEQWNATGELLAAGGDAATAANEEGDGWTWFSRRDDVPLCAFSSYREYERASFLKDVKRTAQLRSNAILVFGTYGPGCASRDCIRVPTLQCWTELEGRTITVHTRYSGQHRAEAVCKSNCEAVHAACETPELEAGGYTLKYGDRTRSLKVPGALRPSCVLDD